jgi:hypothetical protein
MNLGEWLCWIILAFVTFGQGRGDWFRRDRCPRQSGVDTPGKTET